MEKVHAGHEILNLLCPPLKSHSQLGALTEKILGKGILISIVSAFLIVLSAALALRLAATRLEAKVTISRAQVQIEEKVGWLPGQHIKSEMGGGYLGQ